MHIAPPLDTPSEMESLVPVVFDSFSSHQLNKFAPLSVVFCLPGCFFSTSVPLTATFLVRQHPVNEVFEAANEDEGSFRERTTPPS
eukprot:MONOS_12549.1-p1 / transcript=MONOS_12549.1 / gene=MONOS_12549 / organism=Monocercomonoides_exilis_PA203 / gene_product=unspecified product / transcript_product=unspecified product / location=Mono_scaffold00701:7019-7276(-) / protein_length=86 / sequence_SO=supercontig / SO=protein_coding / is_pseudo=false